jgi:fumarate reductase (CoM/CoB) subunit B
MLKEDQKAINQCVRCGACRAVCPVFQESGWESANTRGRIMILKGLDCDLSPDLQILDSLNSCTTCAICTELCPAGVNPPRLIESGRRELVLKGVMTGQQKALAGNVLSSGNTFGAEDDRLSWLADRSHILEKAEFVYFVGCMNSYRYTKTAARTFALLHRFGATVLPAEKCCGSPLLRTGFDAHKLVEENSRQIREIGASTVITGCAGCYTTLKNSYSGDFKVKSVSEFLAEHISELDLKRLDLTAAYHDPCHLGRHSRIYDPPRDLIKAVCNLREMKTSRELARCCGGGGGVRSGYQDLSLKMAQRRLAEVPEGVDYIVTSCPLCIRNLRDAGAGEKVIDLVDLLTMALPGEPS